MRIGLVVERFDPRGGGVEQAAWETAHALAEAGDDVQVVARRAARTRLAVHRVSVSEGWQPWRVLAFSRRAHRLLERLGVEFVHSFARTRHQHLYRAGGGSHAAYMARTYGPVGCALRRASPRHAVLLRLEAGVFGDAAQRIQCASSRVRDEIADRYGVAADRFAVLPNGVDTERFHPTRHAAAARALRQQEGGPQRAWLFAGSGWRRKGLDTALRALAAEGDPETHLWVAGRDAPGPWQTRAQSLGLAGRVRFLGERDDLEVVLAAADGLLLPTRYDAFANVCLEAAASARAVVTSGVSGSAEWLGEGARVVTNPEDADGFAQALASLAAPEPRAAMGETGRKRARELTWQAHAERLRRLYRAGSE
ncbi:MAG: glycosyltransferase family 4 protein [Proteobacteria bacterium]|nr:glycosyltransferase family 4 protein [Pseudomonadota bacterium]